MSQRYFIKLAFKGTNYHGWQVQDNALSVQEVLNNDLSKITGEEVETVGAGRTDTGVHAAEFYAHFDSERLDLDEPYYLYKLNRMLPPDICIYKIIKVKPGAHARFNAALRTYQYFINSFKDPFKQEFSYYLYNPLDVNLMNEAALILMEFSDFSCFSKSRTQVKTNNCIIKTASWKSEGNALVFTISADRFLRNMVRAIVGTLIEVGQKRITIKDFEQIIINKNRSGAGLSVPACGLFLTEVKYPENLFE